MPIGVTQISQPGNPWPIFLVDACDQAIDETNLRPLYQYLQRL
jgi:hypothetical protein